MEFFNIFLNQPELLSPQDFSKLRDEIFNIVQPNFESSSIEVTDEIESFLDTDEIIIEELSEDDENFRIAHENLSQSSCVEKYTQNYPCILCNVTFTSKFNLERHFSSLRHQKTENDFISTTEVEEKISIDEMIVEDRHFIEIHCCKDCSMEFSRTKDLIAHRRKFHSKFKCEKCNRRSKNEVDHHFHMKRHEKSSDYPCGVCGKKFTNNQNRMRHERTHEGAKKFECQICRRNFDQKSNLLRHLKVHEVKVCK